MSATRFVTVCTRSRLAGAAALARSLEQFHPGVPRLLVLAEREAKREDGACGWEIAPVSALPLPGGPRFLFQYGPFELCCALKPFALAAALGVEGTRGAVYLDTDMLALAPFLDLVEAAWNDADVWLTPHLRTTAAPARFAPFLHNGAYNAGFLAVAARPEGRLFLEWLSARVARDCVRDFRNGLFVDQKWLDLAAGLLPGIRPLSYPGLNIGHWNLHEHRFEERADGSLWLDGAIPAALFHFSGLEADRLSRHGEEGAVAEPVRALAARYRQHLAFHAARFPEGAEYTFAAFSGGAPILPRHREAVRLGLASAPDPFSDPSGVEAASAGIAPPLPGEAEALEADARLRRLLAHPVIGRVWRFWKHWVNHDLP